MKAKEKEELHKTEEIKETQLNVMHDLGKDHFAREDIIGTSGKVWMGSERMY